MPRRKYHRDRVYQEVGEPGPGATGIGYVRYSSDLQAESSLTTQKRLIKDFFKLTNCLLYSLFDVTRCRKTFLGSTKGENKSALLTTHQDNFRNLLLQGSVVRSGESPENRFVSP